MCEKVSEQKWRSFEVWFLRIGIIITLIAIFIIEEIAEYRMQALSFFLGLGLFFWGRDIILKQEFVFTIRSRKKKNTVIKKTGEKAKTIGGIICIVGFFLTIWGAVFWISFIRSIIRGLKQ